jgi:WD40 repeat protein
MPVELVMPSGAPTSRTSPFRVLTRTWHKTPAGTEGQKIPRRLYDAFISYSHKGERELARSLQKILWTFGRPWYGLRGIRTYRDETNLAAEPDLWPTIERAVKESDCLVLLASPDSARSEWVHKEVQTCLAEQRRLLVVQTGGVLSWTDGIGKEEIARRPDAALSIRMQEYFAGSGAVPGIVDLRAFRNTSEAELKRDTEYLSRVVRLAASILQKRPEELWGEYHNSQRLRVLFLTVTSVLLIGLLVAVGFLWRSETKAKRIATARYLAAEGLRIVHESGSKVGLVLLVESIRQAETPEALGALFSVVSIDPHLSIERFRLPKNASSLAFSGAGLLAAGLPDGTVAIQDLRTGLGTLEQNVEAGKQSTILTGGSAGVQMLTFTNGGTRLVGLSSSGERLEWNPSATTEPVRRNTVAARAEAEDSEFLGLSSNGRVVISGDFVGPLKSYDVDGNETNEINRHLCWGDPVALSGDGTLLACGEASDKFRGVRVYDRRTMKTKGEIPVPFPVIAVSLAFSDSGNLLAVGCTGGILLLSRTADKGQRNLVELDHEPDPYKRLDDDQEVDLPKFSPDEEFLVSRYRNAGYLWDVPSSERLAHLPGQVPTAFGFSPDSHKLAVADVTASVRVWDLRAASWVDWACREADVNLTEQEWKRYLPGQAYGKSCVPGN